MNTTLEILNELETDINKNFKFYWDISAIDLPIVYLSARYQQITDRGFEFLLILTGKGISKSTYIELIETERKFKEKLALRTQKNDSGSIRVKNESANFRYYIEEMQITPDSNKTDSMTKYEKMFKLKVEII